MKSLKLRVKKVNERLHKGINNRGLSLVELVCAIGIMGLVGASVAGFMIVGANTYSRGASEANLQEEAQLLASQINNIVQDASHVETNAIGDSITLTRAGVEYTVYRDGSDDTVYYSVVDETAPMADNIKVFLADATDFDNTGMLQLYICLEKSGNSYAGNYTISSRNVNDARTMTEGELTMTYVPEYVLEPNQTYPLTARMSDGSGVNFELSGNTDPNTVITTDAMTGAKVVKIGKDEEASEITVVITSKTRMISDGLTPAVQKTANIYIRRVRSLSYVDVTNSNSRAAGFTHKLTASVDGSYLAQIPSIQGGDPGYTPGNPGAGANAGIYTTISPKDIYWEVIFFKNGLEQSDYSAYLDVNAVKDGNSGPRCDIKLKQNLDKYDYIIVNMYSTHSNGFMVEGGVNKPTNITGQKYSNVYGQWILADPNGFIQLEGDGILRGTDIEQGKFLAIDLLKYIIPHDNPGVHDYDLKFITVHRFREVNKNIDGTYSYGPWTAWRDNLQEGANSNAINLRPITTCSLDYEKSYQVQIKVIVRNVTDRSIVYWPKDDTPSEQYLIEGIVNPLSLFFNVGSYTRISGLGTFDSPQTIASDNVWGFYYKECEAAREDWVKDTISFKIQRYESDGWVDAELCNERENNLANSINDVFYKDHNLAFEREGLYRIIVSSNGLKKSTYIPVNEGVAGKDNYKYVDNVNCQYYDEGTGKGIFYFYCNGTSDKWKQRFVEYDGKKYNGAEYFVCDNTLFKKSDFGDKKASETVNGKVVSAFVTGNIIYYCSDGANYEKLTCYWKNNKYELTWADGSKSTFTQPNFGNTLNNAIGFIPKN